MWKVFFERIVIVGLLTAVGAALCVVAAHAQRLESTQPELRIASPFAGSLWQVDLDQASSDTAMSSKEKIPNHIVMSTSNETATVFDLTGWRAGEAETKYRTTGASKARAETFRVPSRDRQKTRSMGVAISADASRVALAVPPLAGPLGLQRVGTGAIYIFDRVNKAIILTGPFGLNGLPIPTSAPKLKFSPDGAYLVAALSYGCGVRIWETTTWALVGSDDEGFAPTHTVEKPYCGIDEQAEDNKDSLSVYSSFDILFRHGDDLQLWFTVLGQTGLRNYRKSAPGSGNVVALAKFQPTAKIGLAQPRSLALDSTGRRMAIGDDLTMRIALVDPDTLEPLSPGIVEVPEAYIAGKFRQQADYQVSQVAWLGEGNNERLYAGGFLSTERLSEEGRRHLADPDSQTRKTFGEFTNNLARWDLADLAQGPQLVPFGTDSIMALRPMPGGVTMLAAALNAMAVISFSTPDEASSVHYVGRNLALDFRFSELSIRPEGESIRVTNYEGSARPVVTAFHLRDSETGLPQFVAFPRGSDEAKDLLADPSYRPAPAPEAVVGTWQNWEVPFTHKLPRFFGKELNPIGVLFNPELRDRNELSRSVAVSPDGKQVLWGTSSALRLVENGTDYAEVTCSIRMKTESTLVGFARGDALAVTAQSDGMIRWFDIKKESAGCQFVPRLGVYAEEAAGDRWVWAAFRPDGKFHLPDLQEKFLGWQFTEKSGQVRFSDLNKTIRKFYTFDMHDALAKDAGAAEIDTELIKQELAEQFPYGIQLDDSKPTILPQVQRINLPIRVSGIEEAGAPMEGKLVIAGVEIDVVLSNSAITSSTVLPSKTLVFERSGTYWLTFNIPRKVQTQTGPFKIGFRYWRQRLGALPVEPKTVEFNKFDWQGPVLPAQPKRTFAIIAGFSGYNNFNYLEYAHKDAIDMAQILLADFKNELQAETGSRLKRDTWQLSISLLLSYAKKDAEQTAILLDSLRAEAEAIRDMTGANPLQITQELVSSPLQAQPEKSTRDFKTAIVKTLDRFGSLKDSKDYRDAIIFYYSGHGVSETRGSNSIAAQPDVRDYLLAPGSAGLEDDQISPAQALSSQEITAQLMDASPEKIIIIDACRNLKGGSDKIDPSVYFFDAYQDLRFASVFLSGNIGETSKIIPYAKWPKKYPDLYGSVVVPDRLAGNSLFTHIVLQAFLCKEGAMGRDIIDAQGLDVFIRRYLTEPSTQRAELQRVVSKLPAPKVSKSSQLFDYVGAPPIQPWFRVLAPEAKKCVDFTD